MWIFIHFSTLRAFCAILCLKISYKFLFKATSVTLRVALEYCTENLVINNKIIDSKSMTYYNVLNKLCTCSEMNVFL